MDDYYDYVQKELLGKMEAIRSLSNKAPAKVLGDYYEALIRDFLRGHLPDKYAIARGVVMRNGVMSKECDVLIYNRMEHTPMFKAGDYVVLDPLAVEIAIEIRSEINTEAIKTAVDMKNSILAVEEVGSSYRRRGYFLLGFYTSYKLETIRVPLGGYAFVLSKERTVKGQRERIIERGEIGRLLKVLENYDIGNMTDRDIKRT